jgi:nitroimidazol reductase NimA-like FMN-containing flavoprotein (pyridoxamine 5'-phosphate oxidase superfamily)
MTVAEFSPTDRTRLRRRPQRGSYDEATIFGILDAGLIAHLGYTLDGHPFVTPTVYWREGRRLYWHGAAASRALRAQSGQPVCVTVSALDALVVARSGFACSVNYRGVMAFGRPALLESRDGKRRAMDAFIERLYPGRTRETRAVADKELDMIAVLAMEIDEASAKVRNDGVIEKSEEDARAPGWAGLIPVRMQVGAALPDPRIAAGEPLPRSLAAYAEGVALDEALKKTAAAGSRAGA